MPQFTVHRNPNPATKAAIPYLLNVQSDLIVDLGTRVAVPLYPASTLKGASIHTLMPIFEIDGKRFVMMTPQLAGIPKRLLGTAVTDLSHKRDEIISALDLLIIGI